MVALVARYHDLTTTERRQLNEAETCHRFILPLFRLLGWQVEPDANGNTDVVEQLAIAGTRVDYAFRLRGVSRFMLEAKRLDTDMTMPQWSEQAVNYAYNKAVRWSVLTNFHTLQVFNALKEGRPGDHIVLNLTCDQFLMEADKLWLLSKEAFADAQLEREATLTGGAEPRQPVEQKLAAQLKRARQDVYGELSVRNPTMPGADIDDLVQSLLNRLVFIRTAEDRGIENERLREAVNQYRKGVLPRSLLDELRAIFAYYGQTYDSDLFPQAMDRWNTVYVDDPRLRDVISSLYKPGGTTIEFDFSAISADALGQVYEQFLGFEVQQGTSTTQAGLPGMSQPHTEPKRAQRRKRGIYYTPRFIVDYIVQHTVEALLYEHPERLADIRVADIACGSGSFLIKAYDVLLEAAGSGISQSERLELLRRSIYGVDLDGHAIDVARLNLLLRALADPMQLPMLAGNLVVGNSLIEGTAAELRPFFGDDWAAKKRFQFTEAFPQVASEGGFDVIVGNPPYVEIQTQDRREAEYVRANYAVSGNFDVYLPFIERGLSLLRPGGRLGFIAPHKFMTNQYGRKLRRLLADAAAVEEIVHFGDQQIFDGVTTYTCVLLLRKDAGLSTTRLIRPAGVNAAGAQDRERLEDTVRALDHGAVPPGCSAERGSIAHPTADGAWDLALGATRALVERLKADNKPLSEVASRVFQGLITSADHIYHLRRTTLRGGAAGFQRFKRATGEPPGQFGVAEVIEPELMRPLVSGPDVDRYTFRPSDVHLLFPYSVANGVATLIPADEMKTSYPVGWAYLKKYESQLRGREANAETGGQPFDDDAWYRFGRRQNLSLHEGKKLAVPATVRRLSAAWDQDGQYVLNNVRVGGVLLGGGTDDGYLWLVSLLNSRVLDFVFKQQESTFQNRYFQANRQFIDPLPIAGMERDPGLTRQIIALAKDMHSNRVDFGRAHPADAGLRSRLDKEFADADAEMEQLACDAYGLDASERALVMG